MPVDKYAQTKLISSTQSMNNPTLHVHVGAVATQLLINLEEIDAA